MKKKYNAPQTICIDIDMDVMMLAGSNERQYIHYSDNEYADESDIY